MQLTPYLIFDGDCRQAFEFYQRCLGGEIVAMIDHSSPEMAPHAPPGWGDKIMHARLIAGGAVLMGSDNMPGQSGKKEGFSVSLQVDTPEEAERFFTALSQDATITMPLGPTFWAVSFGMLTDRFGVAWMVNCEAAA